MAEPDEIGVDERGEALIGYAVPFRNPWRVRVVVFSVVVLGVTGPLVVMVLFDRRHLGPWRPSVTSDLVVAAGFGLSLFSAWLLLAASRHRLLVSSALVCTACGLVGLGVGGLPTLSDYSLITAELGWLIGCCAISLFRGKPSWSTACKACGYDAVGLAVCRECGWRLPARVVRRPRPTLTRAQWWRRVVLGWVVPSVLLLVFSALLLWG